MRSTTCHHKIHAAMCYGFLLYCNDRFLLLAASKPYRWSTNDMAYLQQAEETYHYNKARNHNTLLHEFYDDMLWNALAGLFFKYLLFPDID